MKKVLGSERLGGGDKISVNLKNFGRSNFNQSENLLTTIAPGILYPVYQNIGTNGDSFDIDIEANVRTLPTIAPLFGAFKLQYDFFVCPIRLYQGMLHNNLLGIGMQMQNVKFPKLAFKVSTWNQIPEMRDGNDVPLGINNVFSHPASMLGYLDNRGFPWNPVDDTEVDGFGVIKTNYSNALAPIAYYDIFKNYYANKMEKYAKVIRYTEEGNQGPNPGMGYVVRSPREKTPVFNPNVIGDKIEIFLEEKQLKFKKGERIEIDVVTPKYIEDPTGIILEGIDDKGERVKIQMEGVDRIKSMTEGDTRTVTFAKWCDLTSWMLINMYDINGNQFIDGGGGINPEYKLTLYNFQLANCDKMRKDILAAGLENDNVTIDDSDESYYPYKSLVEYHDENVKWDDQIIEIRRPNNIFAHNGLVVKTYQSDMFNNWVDSELVNGNGSANELSKVKVEFNAARDEASFKLDVLNMSKRVYNLLNRIAAAGNTWQDWQEAVWGEKAISHLEIPMYIGGYSSEVVFEEIVSSVQSSNGQPLGTLGGKGTMIKPQGGKVKINCSEPCLIMGILSLTPRVDYNQTHSWINDLDNMDELHKPEFDGIGYQDLLEKNMAWWAQNRNENDTDEIMNVGVGKQTAWLHYQTAVDKIKGNFAIENNQMYMTLARNYEEVFDKQRGGWLIKDMTTYIDPTKYNYAFAEGDLDSMNFWVKINNKVHARRKMSSAQIPNL